MYKLALGTAQFGMSYGIANTSGQVSRDEAKAILELASVNGIDTIDTAIAYGESEACLGDVGVENFRVATKLPPLPDGVTTIEEWIEGEVEASLKRLRLDSLYGLLLHRSVQFGIPAVRAALERLKQGGKVQKIGVSIYSPDDLDAIPVVGALDIVQAPLNLVDRRLFTSGWLDRLHGDGIEIHTRSAFLQGLLVIPRSSIPDRFSRWNSLWDTWHAWLSASNMAAIQACLVYALSFPEVDRVVVGVETAQQLNQLIEAATEPMNIEFPDIASTEEQLINPSLWSSL